MITIYAVTYMDNVYSVHIDRDEAYDEADRCHHSVQELYVGTDAAEQLLFGD